MSVEFHNPLVTVDLAIFRYAEGQLQVLLVTRPAHSTEPFPGHWALPGGFVDINLDEDLEACARRKLKEKTGISTAYLEQVGAWGGISRDPRGWSVTHAYFSLVSPDEVNPVAGGNAGDARWVDVTQSDICGRLAFDHSMLLASSIERLRNKVEYTSLPGFLMPREFTLGEFQRTYEVLLGRSLEKKSFRTRVLSADLLEPTSRFREGSNRPARVYRLKSKKKAVYFARALERAH